MSAKECVRRVQQIVDPLSGPDWIDFSQANHFSFVGSLDEAVDARAQDEAEVYNARDPGPAKSNVKSRPKRTCGLQNGANLPDGVMWSCTRAFGAEF